MDVVTRAQAKRRESQQSDGEDRGGGDADFISLLPDEILGSIITLLPIKQGARTQVLSSRWCRLWRSAPLNLETRGISSDDVSRILSKHQGVARRFKATDDPATVDSWLRFPALDNLQELDFSGYSWIWPTPVMPYSVLRFSSTLRTAKISCCILPDNAAHQVHLPNLQHLELESVTISEDSLHAMLAGCPALCRFRCYNDDEEESQMPHSALHFPSTVCIAEFGRWEFPDIVTHQFQCPNLQRLVLELVAISEGSLHAMLSSCPALNSLKLEYSNGFRQFRINSLKLRHVEMYFCYTSAATLHELIVENAPCLETLYRCGPLDENMRISIISAPKLKILGCLSDINSRLELGTTVFEGLHNVRMGTVMRSVKLLSLRLDNLRLDVIINLMRCFPCMEELHIKVFHTDMARKHMKRHYSRDCIQCLDNLKKLHISYYSGQKSHVEFVKFFVLNASVLESLVLDVDPSYKESGWCIEDHGRQLQLEKRASIGAQLEFTFGKYLGYHSDAYFRSVVRGSV